MFKSVRSLKIFCNAILKAGKIKVFCVSKEYRELILLGKSIATSCDY